MLRPVQFLPREGILSGLLPWVIGVMTFLTGLTLVAGLSLRSGVADWRADLSRSLTVQIVASDPAVIAVEKAAAIQLLEQTPGVENAVALSQEDNADLLAPWIGALNVVGDLPLPALIDVTLRPGIRLDLGALNLQLQKVAPHAEIDDHQQWLAKVLRLAYLAQWGALLLIALVGVATVAIVVFATRAGLSTQREVIEIVHMMGAQDKLISAAFERRFLLVGLTGAGIGVIGVSLVLMVLMLATDQFAAQHLPALTPTGGALFALLVVPLPTAALTMLTTRLTVLRALAHMV